MKFVRKDRSFVPNLGTVECALRMSPVVAVRFDGTSASIDEINRAVASEVGWRGLGGIPRPVVDGAGVPWPKDGIDSVDFAVFQAPPSSGAGIAGTLPSGGVVLFYGGLFLDFVDSETFEREWEPMSPAPVEGAPVQ